MIDCLSAVYRALQLDCLHSKRLVESRRQGRLFGMQLTLPNLSTITQLRSIDFYNRPKKARSSIRANLKRTAQAA